MAANENPYEDLQRLRKAIALADVLDAWQADAETVEGLDSSAWSATAGLAEVKPPSAVTKAIVVDLIRGRHKARGLVQPTG